MNQQKYLVTVTVLSLLTCVLHILAFTTEHWLDATAILTDRLRSNVSYGLFSGFVKRHQLASTLKFTLTVVCNIDSNACMFSCQSDSYHRKDELKRVIQGQDLNPCEQKRFIEIKQNDQVSINTTKYKFPYLARSSKNTSAYISASLYICCVMFLCLAFVFSLISCFCSAINLKWHPVERIFNIFGLFVWNGVAVICGFWSLAFWSSLFGSELRYNIAITDTLRQQLKFTSEGYASLGYSYYLVVVVVVLHIINLVLLVARNQSIDKEPHQLPNNLTLDDAEARLEFY